MHKSQAPGVTGPGYRYWGRFFPPMCVGVAAWIICDLCELCWQHKKGRPMVGKWQTTAANTCCASSNATDKHLPHSRTHHPSPGKNAQPKEVAQCVKCHMCVANKFTQMFQYSHACQHNKKKPHAPAFRGDTDKLRIYCDIRRQANEFPREKIKQLSPTWKKSLCYTQFSEYKYNNIALLKKFIFLYERVKLYSQRWLFYFQHSSDS